MTNRNSFLGAMLAAVILSTTATATATAGLTMSQPQRAKVAKRATKPLLFRECVIGVWPSVRQRPGKPLELELHYPRYSSQQYQMSYYMWFYAVKPMPGLRERIAAMKAERGRQVWIGRNDARDKWQLAGPGVCPVYTGRL